EVCKYNSHGANFYTKEMALQYIKSVQNNSTCKVFAVCLRDSNMHIGNISLQQITTKEAEFAILMGEKKYWGKGYATEAGKILFSFAFNKLNLKRVYCGTSEANLPMQKLAISLGMFYYTRKENALFKNNNFFDVLFYKIKKP
ncbi:MAG: GNAT family N-acetyltransferase, partial [Campylobacterota bacterium]|nr:GNAT family N-acetyltransferase [Campylobacterota bacterium]